METCKKILAVILLCGLPLLVAAASPQVEGEGAWAEKVRSNRASLEELVRAGEKLSFWQKTKLWLYSQELAPYFEGLEDRIRALAKSDPADVGNLGRAGAALAASLGECRARLLAAGREEPQRDWRRGITGLIFLDNQWRDRVAQRKTGEIKNLYALAPLLNCLERNLARGPAGAAAACPLRPKENGEMEP